MIAWNTQYGIYLLKVYAFIPTTFFKYVPHLNNKVNMVSTWYWSILESNTAKNIWYQWQQTIIY